MANLSTERLSYQTALIALLEGLNLSGSSSILAVRLTLINMVKIKLDELVPEGEGVVYDLETEPNISDPLDLYINGLLDEAAKKTLLLAPLEVLHPVKSDATAVQDSSDTKIGTITLPDSFLRFVSLKMVDWARPVTKIISIYDPLYLLQSNIYVRGGTAKPVAALSTAPTGYGSAVAQVDTLTLTGADSGNIAVVSCAGMEQMCPWEATLTLTASAFVTENAADFLIVGIVLTSSGDDLIFTANVAGTPFEHASIYAYSGDDAGGTVVYTTPNVDPNVYYRVIEYYSVNTSHVIDYLYYIKVLAAEDVQDNLYDALTWITAGMIQQLIEKQDLSELAFKQAVACLPQL